MTAPVHDEPDDHDRIYLEKLRLAADIIPQFGEDPGVIPDTLLKANSGYSEIE